MANSGRTYRVYEDWQGEPKNHWQLCGEPTVPGVDYDDMDTSSDQNLVGSCELRVRLRHARSCTSPPQASPEPIALESGGMQAMSGKTDSI